MAQRNTYFQDEEVKAENINIDLSNLRKLIIERNVSEVNLSIDLSFSIRYPTKPQ